MTVTVGDVTRCVTTEVDDKGNTFQNTWYVHNSGLSGVSDSDFLTGIEARFSIVYDFLQDKRPIALSPVSIECDQVGFYSGRLVTMRPVGEIAWTTGGGGTGTGDRLPSFVSISVALPTQLPRVVGGKRFGPLVTSAVAGDYVSTSALSDLYLTCQVIMSIFQIDSQDFQFGLMVKKAEGFVVPTAAVPSVRVGHQNTRKLGVGI